jgi:hypothetical protein
MHHFALPIAIHKPLGGICSLTQLLTYEQMRYSSEVASIMLPTDGDLTAGFDMLHHNHC